MTASNPPSETAPVASAGGMAPIDTRLKIAALWIVTLFLYVYVDLFSFYKPGVFEKIEAGTVGGFDINQTFLLFTIAFIAVPSVMIYLSLVLAPKVNRVANTVVPVVWGLAGLASAWGEWGYYIAGTIIETIMLVGVIFHARTLR